MRNIILFFVLLVSHIIDAQTTRVHHIFCEEGLSIQNPVNADGSFCIDSIFAKGNKYLDDIQEEVLRLRFNPDSFDIGDSILVTLYHSKECRPSVLRSKSCYFNISHFTELYIDTNANLHFALEKPEKVTHYLQQYRWNQWITWETAFTTESNTTGSIDLSLFLHTGENKFRIQSNTTKGTTYSETLYVQNNQIRNYLMYAERMIRFDRASHYIIYDEKGQLMEQGRRKTVDISTYPRGNYMVNYDNTYQKVKVR